MESPTAVITDCQHFFHKHCLKKWLVVQDNCPLCTKPIVTAEEAEVISERLPLESEESSQIDESVEEGGEVELH